MARTINETASVQVTEEKTFNQQSVIGVKIASGSMRSDIEKSSDQHEAVKNESVVADISALTVQTALDELEAFLGQAPNLSELSFEDFIHSVVHERSISE